MDASLFAELSDRIAGEVVLPGNPTYDDLRNVFNRTGNPAGIVRARNHADLVTALRFAREQGLAISVRSGGHGLTGAATNDGGLVLDLSHFKNVEILDSVRHLVRVGAGARWGEVARALGSWGLALSSGDTNQVGVGGLTLGGGIGWMVRTSGLTIDHLHAAELLTADGHLLRVSAEEHPDLFWAIRGGGGNFGIVTSFELHAHPCPTVVGGLVSYNTAERETVLTNWARAMRAAPETLNSTIVLFSGFGPQMPSQIMVFLCYAGDDEVKADHAIQPLLHLGTVESQDIRKRPYHTMLEDAAPPPGVRTASHNGFLKTLSSEMLTLLATHYGQAGQPLAQIRSLGGAMARVSSQETAFAHRENEALVVVPAFAPVNATEEQTHQIRQAAWRPLEPWASGAYVNFLSEASEASVAAAYPSATYARLARIKALYDPDNVFHFNQNIKPVLDKLVEKRDL